MHNKKGFQLTMSFTVTLILAIVMFGLGMIFFSDIFREASDVKARLDSQTDKQIRDILLSTGEKVAIPFDKAEVNAGDTATFGVGIFNIPHAEAPTDFKVSWVDGSCTCINKKEGDCDNADSGITGVGFDSSLKIDPNQQRVAVVGFVIPEGIPYGSQIICTMQVKSCKRSDSDAPCASFNKNYGPKQQVYIKT